MTGTWTTSVNHGGSLLVDGGVLVRRTSAGGLQKYRIEGRGPRIKASSVLYIPCTRISQRLVEAKGKLKHQNMSKKIEDSELQTLTLSPTNTNDDESSPFVNPASDETSFPISPPPSFSTVTTSSTEPPGEKRKLERMVSVPGTGANTNKPLPTLRVSTPPSTTQITYTNEESNERKIDLSKICRERPTPGNSIGQKKDVADVRQIEQGLLQLMEDFQAGNLRAFGKDSRLRQMEAIREQQERLARLHFDVGAEQDLFPPLSEEGLRTSHDNMRTLMEKLAQLSESIERLHTNTSSERKTSSNERKCSSNQRATENVGHSKFHSGAWNQQMPDGHHSSDQHGNYGHMNNNAQHTSPANSRLGHGQHSTNRLRNSAGNPMSGIMKSGKLADS
ncbi:uncharacterized protein LOC121877410 isoform X3 [Homarus americanus]|uniref:uncharacterized protein LOC121877410 isoform X3 n=1 Tax=Homarus americanus TaxID=6706 RepID=UPI001C467428|nr:uncharacterized protein LOC121877410 isoform X3 [Homarus americanus]